MWPFNRKKPEPPAIPDGRVWNENWKIGDTAECIVDGVKQIWHADFEPWLRPELGQQFTVIGFSEGIDRDNIRRYFLKLADWPCTITCTSFRKVRPVAAEHSEVVSRILNAKPGADNPREDA